LLLDPVLDARIRGEVAGRFQVQVPARAILVARVLNGLGRHQRWGVIVGLSDGEHVADRRLADQPLLGRDAHAGFGGRVVEPESARVEKHGFAGVARGLHISDQVAELMGARILLREDRQDALCLGFAGDVFGEGRDETKRFVRIANLVCPLDDFRRRLGASHVREQGHRRRDRNTPSLGWIRHGGARPQSGVWPLGSLGTTRREWR